MVLRTPEDVHKHQQSLPSLAVINYSLGSSSGRGKQGNLSQISSRRNRPSLLAQASGDEVCLLLNGQKLIKTLSLKPKNSDLSLEMKDHNGVECVSLYDDMDSNLIFVSAASGEHVIIWSTIAFATGKEKWRVHSTLQLSTGTSIRSIDLQRGTLLIGTQDHLSLWKLAHGTNNTWKRHWKLHTPRPVQDAKFSPMEHKFAVLLEKDRQVTIWSIAEDFREKNAKKVGCIDRLRHSRVIDNWSWRGEVQESNQTSSIITRTIDGVVRIWASVVDDPTCMRVWSTIDSEKVFTNEVASSTSEKRLSKYHYLDASEMRIMMQSSLQWLLRDLQVVEMAISEEPCNEREVETKRSRAKRLEHLINETPDMFALLDKDNHLVIRALANLDRRPPTLCQSFVVLKMDSPQLSRLSTSIYSITAYAQSTNPSSVHDSPSGLLIVTLCNGDVCKFLISPSMLFDGLGQGLTSLDLQPVEGTMSTSLPCTHRRSITSLVDLPNGKGFCSVSIDGDIIQWKSEDTSEKLLLHPRRLHMVPPDCKVMAASSNCFAWYKGGAQCTLIYTFKGSTLHYCLDIPHGTLSFMTIVEHNECIYIIGGEEEEEEEAVVCLWIVTKKSAGSDATDGIRITLAKRIQLPLDSPIQFYFAVPHQPTNSETLRIGSADNAGHISIMSFSTLKNNNETSREMTLCLDKSAIVSIQISADEMMAIMVDTHTIEVYDTRLAHFSTKAEAILFFDEAITSFSWSLVDDDGISMLAISSQSTVEIYCRRRLSYLDGVSKTSAPTWIPICKVDASQVSLDAIASITWLFDGSLIVAISNCILRYDGTCLDEDVAVPSQCQMKLLALEQAGQLEDYHPEMLIQCLLWNKVGLTNQILVNLANAIKRNSTEINAQDVKFDWEAAHDIEFAWSKEKRIIQTIDMDTSINKEASTNGIDDRLAALNELEEKLQTQMIFIYTPTLRDQLLDVIKTTILIHQLSDSIDSDSMRYLISLSCSMNHDNVNLDHQAFLWAFYSEKQEALLSILNTHYFHEKMDWIKARFCGLFYWLQSHEALCLQAEIIARHQFNSQDERNPISCSLLYYALGKHKLVVSLWKQAYWHPDQRKMLAFLNNDFNLPRWKSAALKNAYALMSQRKFEMAASFFLLGGQLKDAVNVCVRNLQDVSLAIAITRLSEGGINGPIFCNLLQSTILPLAIKTNNRFLANWTLQMLGQDDLALACLCQSMDNAQIIKTTSLESSEIVRVDNEEAILTAHFSRQLQQKSLSTSLPPDIESQLLLTANHILQKNGLASLGVAVLMSHQLQGKKKPSVDEILIDSKQSLAANSNEKGSQASTLSLSTPLDKKKVASLMQNAKEETTRQAEMAFDMNSFNF